MLRCGVERLCCTLPRSTPGSYASCPAINANHPPSSPLTVQEPLELERGRCDQSLQAPHHVRRGLFRATLYTTMLGNEQQWNIAPIRTTNQPSIFKSHLGAAREAAHSSHGWRGGAGKAAVCGPGGPGGPGRVPCRGSAALVWEHHCWHGIVRGRTARVLGQHRVRPGAEGVAGRPGWFLRSSELPPFHSPVTGDARLPRQPHPCSTHESNVHVSLGLWGTVGKGRVLE